MWIQVVRWAARIIGLFPVGLVSWFAIAHAIGGEFKLLTPTESLQMTAFVVAHLGMLVLWRWELLGALMNVGGMIGFCAVDYVTTGHNIVGGFAFWFVPGLLALFCWGYTYVEKRRGLQQKTDHTGTPPSQPSQVAG
ncbi:MAG: hypothetical protein HOL01_17835 [Planctomycetaceae bacterium]|jgi:hypothetical protein|nr:hypothetical protein [Planctomycetaceae bacterium]MBT6484097.1 hypothetical protein [Planctomycetaceae bacterium]MBT6496408.1 hypothetical protein [Planctomycetaceae bacterium]